MHRYVYICFVLFCFIHFGPHHWCTGLTHGSVKKDITLGKFQETIFCDRDQTRPDHRYDKLLYSWTNSSTPKIYRKRAKYPKILKTNHEYKIKEM